MTDATILDDIPFEIEIEPLMEKVRVSEGTKHADAFRLIADHAAIIARPRAMFRAANVESTDGDTVMVDGIPLTSKVLRVNLEGIGRVFPYVATCGPETEEWARGLDSMLDRYWADALQQAALMQAADAVTRRIEAELGPGASASMNPGSLDVWPIEQQRQLFDLLGDPRDAIGVGLTDSFLMTPMKSISGIRFPNESGFENCRLCKQEDCPNRQEPYDEAELQTYLEGH